MDFAITFPNHKKNPKKHVFDFPLLLSSHISIVSIARSAHMLSKAIFIVIYWQLVALSQYKRNNNTKQHPAAAPPNETLSVDLFGFRWLINGSVKRITATLFHRVFPTLGLFFILLIDLTQLNHIHKHTCCNLDDWLHGGIKWMDAIHFDLWDF